MKNTFVPNELSKDYQNIKNLMENLHFELQSRLQKQNTFTISEFNEYLPLFSSSSLKSYSIENLIELSSDFFSKIDPYSEIQVIDDITNEIIITLPPIFLPVAKIATNQDNINILESFKSSNNIVDIVQKNKSIYNYATELVQQQLSEEHKSIIREYKQKTKKAIETITQYLSKSNNEKDISLSDNNDTDTISLHSIENEENIEWD